MAMRNGCIDGRSEENSSQHWSLETMTAIVMHGRERSNGFNFDLVNFADWRNCSCES
jgi:hypothetical protein